jgi:hypothetical protein
MLAKKPIVLETEGLGPRRFHGRVVLPVNRHTAGAAETIVAFARENSLATMWQIAAGQRSSLERSDGQQLDCAIDSLLSAPAARAS